MNLPRALRLVLVGVLSLTCAFSAGQQTQKRPAAEKSAPGKATVRPPARKADAADSDESPKRSVRPQPQEFRIEPLPKELEQILKDWERESAKIHKLVGAHERTVYNGVYEVQKISRGQFYYEAPDKGRIDLTGIKPKPGEKAKRKNPKTGEPYRLEKEQDTKWICNGKEVLNINDEEKTIESFPLPEDLQGTNIIHGPLPFLFGMKAEEAKKRFVLSFADQDDPKKNNEKEVWIVAKPRQVMDRDNFQEATIILDRERFLPRAVRLIDPSGNLETVYNFPLNELHVNKKELVPLIFRNSPFQPKTAGYKIIRQDVASPQDPKSAPRDNRGGTKSAVQPAKNETSVAPPNSGSRPKTANSNGGRPKK